MAFATSNVVRENMGAINAIRGIWTGSVGDDVGTVTGSGYATSAEFYPNLGSGSGSHEVILPRISNSSGTWTVTVPYHQAVTAGSFVIRFK